MRRHQPVRSQFFSTSIRAAIKFSDWARRSAYLILLTGVVLASAAVWLTSNTSAHMWVWKGWERMFGSPSVAKVRPRVFAQLGGGGNYTITAIDEPSAGTSAVEGTLVSAVNASGAVTGTYSDQANVGHGFVYANGAYASFDAPGAGMNPTSGWNQGTVGIGIDTAGNVVGMFADSNNAIHGFLREAASPNTITVLDDPNAPKTTSSRGTIAMGINDAGQVIGYYMTGTYDTTSTYQGFIYSIANETFTTIAEPKAGTGNTSYRQKEGTVPIAINDSGALTGYYSDSNAINHGFVYSAGTYASFDVTGATTNTGHGGNLTGTIPDGIDAAGDVVGSYTDSAGVRHGFIRSAASGNPITTFDAPEANTTSQSGTIGGTFPTRIDPTGSYISGIVEDTAGLSHGFVYYLPLTAVASFTVFNAPNAATSLTSFPFTGTGGFGVNASGTVAGIYLDSSEVMHGFKYTPTATQTPTFSPAQGTFNSEQSVSISDADSSAIIYYTTDGSTPTVNSSEYTDPVSVSSTETIKAIALDTSIGGNIESAVASATYTINLALPTATPTISPVAGTYTSTQTVTISDATSGAIIYYTTNGTTPTTSSIIYSAPISVAESETIKAIATANGYSASVVASAAYVISNSGGSTNEWAWIGGSSTVACNSVGCSQPGLYGALGTPAQGNVPGGRQGGATWTDISGNLWLFGGTGFDAGSNGGFLNDLWRFSPSANLWTWMGGSKTVGSSGGQPGVYGTMGVAATGNMPGARSEATSWTDSNGNLWLFGGTGFDSGGGTNDAGRSLFLNDLWKFNPSTLEWTWMGGSSSAVCPSSSTSYCGQPGVYGTKGSSGAGNIPGGRYSATASTDSNGNFWLFGGYGYAAAGACCYLNDLWEFNPSTDVWTWVSGGSGGEQAGLYGTEGTPAPGNAPGSRYYASSWFDQNGDFWLYGGYGFDASSTSGYLDDLWEFNPSTKNWVWLAGSDASTCWSTEACPATAIYGTLGVPAATDTPGNRSGASSWTDKSGNFWLFGSNAWRLSGTTVTNNNLNDLWELNLSPQEWGWMSGSSVSNKTGTYGTLGMPAAGNSPGGREFASSWTDGSGNLWLFGGAGIDASGTSGWLNDLWEYQLSVASLPSAATPTFSPIAGTYNSAQSITISDATAGSTIFYTTNGTTPTTSSSVYSGPITVSLSETIEAIATASAHATSAVGSAAYAINLPAAATPTFSPSAGTYTSAQTVTITDSTPGATIYYSTNGTTPTAGSSVYSGPIAVSSTETIEAIATASDFSDSAAASATYTINIPTNPVPVLAGLSPALTNAGGGAFTITITGSGFIATSVVNWGSAALATQYVSATQLTAQVPASDIGNTATTSITVQTPAPGGGTSNSLFFEVDSAGTTPPTFTTVLDSVTPGSTASYPVTLPSGATGVSVTCLNLPSGASCSYSSTTGAVTIATSSTTPAGTYQITVVFAETLPGAATGFVLLPFLMLPLLLIRRRLSQRGIWITACVWLAMLVGVACTSGCGGGGGGGSSSASAPQTHQVTSSGVVSLTIQ